MSNSVNQDSTFPSLSLNSLFDSQSLTSQNTQTISSTESFIESIEPSQPLVASTPIEAMSTDTKKQNNF